MTMILGCLVLDTPLACERLGSCSAVIRGVNRLRQEVRGVEPKVLVLAATDKLVQLSAEELGYSNCEAALRWPSKLAAYTPAWCRWLAEGPAGGSDFVLVLTTRSPFVRASTLEKCCAEARILERNNGDGYVGTVLDALVSGRDALYRGNRVEVPGARIFRRAAALADKPWDGKLRGVELTTIEAMQITDKETLYAAQHLVEAGF